MRISSILLFSILMFFSCSGDPFIPAECEECNFNCIDEHEDVWTNSCKENFTCRFETQSNRTIDINQEEGLTKGNNQSFSIVSSTEGNIAIADDEFTTFIVFELDKSIESFDIFDTEFLNINLHEKTVCYCANVKFRPITKGCLQGIKNTNGSWRIQGYLEFEQEFKSPFEFDAEFE